MRFIKKLYCKILLLLGYVKKKLNINTKFKIGNFNIILTGDHALPVYKRQYFYYDLYLPNLVSKLKATTSFIDIGCNCGDTFFPCYSQNPNIMYYCIDPEKEFIDLFKKNIRNNKYKLNLEKVKISQNLIGNKLSGHLVGSMGSKKLVKEDSLDNIKSISINEYVETNNVENVSLIKIDTDGYDYNIISSGEEIISKNEPLVFFECYIPTQEQKESYLNILDNFKLLGYHDFCVFDNYGQLITKHCNKEHLCELIEYLFRSKKDDNYGSIIYYDILAYKNSKHEEIVHSSLKMYE